LWRIHLDAFSEVQLPALVNDKNAVSPAQEYQNHSPISVKTTIESVLITVLRNADMWRKKVPLALKVILQFAKLPHQFTMTVKL
jgi:hypothetical protein